MRISKSTLKIAAFVGLVVIVALSILHGYINDWNFTFFDQSK